MRILGWLLLVPALLFVVAGVVSLLALFLSHVVTSIDIPALGYWESFWIVGVIWLWRVPAALVKGYNE